MSTISVAPYLPFGRVRLASQELSEDGLAAVLTLVPDGRTRALCSGCGEAVRSVHSEARRWVRDLRLGTREIILDVRQRRFRCGTCGGTRVEALDFVDRHQRVTKRLARYIADLCRLLSVKAVAEHLGLDWKLVKACDKAVLETEVGGTRTAGLRLLAVDEIALRRHQHYMTVVLDYETGRVVWLGEGRRFDTLGAFFQLMEPHEREAIEAVAMDMWKPYAKAVRTYLPRARIVYDLFHVMADYNEHVLDAVRIAAYRKVKEQEERKVIKGSRFLLYKNERNLTESERPRLRAILDLNEDIATAHILQGRPQGDLAGKESLACPQCPLRLVRPGCRERPSPTDSLRRATHATQARHHRPRPVSDRHRPAGRHQQSDQSHQACRLRIPRS